MFLGVPGNCKGRSLCTDLRYLLTCYCIGLCVCVCVCVCGVWCVCVCVCVKEGGRGNSIMRCLNS